MSIIIGSFNIRDLNFSNENKDGEIQKRDFPLIADMIIKEGFDVVAIQEVNSPMALERIVFFLNKPDIKDFASFIILPFFDPALHKKVKGLYKPLTLSDLFN